METDMSQAAKAYDLVIRGGTVVDGSGAQPYVADVAVRNGVIVEVGEVAGAGREEIDAKGLMVTPGFVDIHTHYDGQATWDERMQPSSWHGVTTVVMGNCGVGFAPCRAKDHELLVRLMEGVEDIPEPVMTEGLPWNWESFPDYLDALEKRRFDVDIGAQLPHAALRVYVMGKRGADREPATDADIAAMRVLAKEAVEAGALGFSTSRAATHKTKAGEPTPTLTAAENELLGIALGLKDAGRGVLQFVGAPTFPALRQMMELSGRPLSFSLSQTAAKPEYWRRSLQLLNDAHADGLEMKAQVCGRPVGILLGLELTMNPFSLHPTYRAMADLPLEERVRRLSDLAVRSKLFSETAGNEEIFDRGTLLDYDNMFPMDDTPDYEPTSDKTLAAEAARAGMRPEQVALDHMLQNGGRGLIYVPFMNYADRNLDAARTMLTHPLALSGLSDGGAHVGMICDGSFPTFLLTHWTRDRPRGDLLTVQEVVRMQTAVTAAWVGLNDRGRIAPGLKADLNVIDYDKLTLHGPEVAYDLPAGGRRLIQRASGYVATVVAGQTTYRDGVATGALPGRLVRGGPPAAALAAE
jgi:N-acyl-D-aspartate/D-glutamate deacylase